MATSRKGSSQAGWALITSGVTQARVETHRLHQLIGKALKVIEGSPEREVCYQLAGDLILHVPRRIEMLEHQLDELGYALSLMGEDHLKDRLPITRRNLVEETVEGAPAFGSQMRRDSARRLARAVARRYAKEA